MRPRIKRGGVFYVISIFLSLIFARWISVAAIPNCRVKCTNTGVAVAMPPNTERFLLCCDFMDCIGGTSLEQREFGLPKEILKDEYNCELTCVKNTESEDYGYGETNIASKVNCNKQTTEGNVSTGQILINTEPINGGNMAVIFGAGIILILMITIVAIVLGIWWRRHKRRREISRAIREGLRMRQTPRNEQVLTSERISRSDETSEWDDIPLEDEPESTNTTDRVSMQRGEYSAPNMSIARTIISCSIFMLFFFDTDGLPCVEFDRQNFSRVDMDDCSSKGVAVYVDLRTNQYCERRIVCPEGMHLRFDNSKMNTECGKKCECPEWTSNGGGCSFFVGDTITSSTIYNEKTNKSLINLIPKECSISLPKEGCSQESFKKRLTRIKLYDETEYFLIESKIQFELPSEPMCIGLDATGINATGTPEYCFNHSCKLDGTSHCRYRPNEMLILIAGGERIPIQAYGSAEMDIFPFEEHKANNSLFSLNCEKEGVEYEVGKVTAIEICARTNCHKITSPSPKGKVIFPIEILLSEHEFIMMVWIEGRLSGKVHRSCNARNVCELITCEFCYHMLQNPQCASKVVLMIAGLCIYLATIVIILAYKILKAVIKLMLLATKGLLMLCTCCRGAKGAWNSKQSFSRSMHRRERKSSRTSYLEPLILVVAIFGLIKMISARLSDTRIFEANEKECQVSKDGLVSCSFDYSAIFKMRPHKQLLNMLLRDHAHRPVGTLSVEILETNMICTKQTRYFTRNFEILTQSAKRCSTKGSCTGKKCQVVRPEDKIPELALANKSPGYSFCQESCGGWGCGCGLFSSGCLFYRIFASPIDSRIFEIFDCIGWELATRVRVALLQGNETVKDELTLYPGLTHLWHDVKLTISAENVPVTKIFAQSFIVSEDRVAVLDDNRLEMISRFRCASRGRAEEFNCTFDPDICRCTSAEITANCDCQPGTGANNALRDPYLLPTRQGNIWLKGLRDGVIAEVKIEAMELDISVRGLIAESRVDASHCDVTLSELKGCYACDAGAALNASCQTDFGSAIANIECGQLVFPLKCSDSPQLQEYIALHQSRTLSSSAHFIRVRLIIWQSLFEPVA